MQGNFSVHEPASALFEFAASLLASPVPFGIRLPSSRVVALDAVVDLSIADLDLGPAVLLVVIASEASDELAFRSDLGV